MLTFDDLKDYFEKFFTSYSPYRDNKVYSIILDKLLQNYFNLSYNEIPSTFKSAFEQQKIPIEFYDNILLSSGFTKEILGKISYKDKEILLKSFTDFNIYKGTLNQIQKVASDFEEELNLYELLIDFRTVFVPYYSLSFLKNQDYTIAENQIIYDSIKINDHIQIPGDINSYRVVIKKENLKIFIDKPFGSDSITIKNVNINRWVFVPELIYSGEKVRSKVLKTFLDYDKIYNATKKYFVSIDQLESNKESLLLPIKSNLIFLDYKKFRDINLLNYLFATIILKEYRKSRFVVYFKDGNYLTNLERIYKLWYYVIFRFYNKGISTSGLPNPDLIFSIDSPYFNLKSSDIERIKSEYNLIDNANEISLFYHKYFTSSFYPLGNNATELSIDQFKIIIENDIGTDLLEYVDKRILNARGIDSEFECSFILDELYSSIMTWAYPDELIRTNIKYLLDSLSYISTSVDLSPTYNLILFLKPFHVELIKESDEILEIDNKFNLVNPDHRFKFFVNLFETSILNISHRILNSKLILTSNDSVILNSSFKHNVFYKCKSFLNYINIILHQISYFEESVMFQSHKDLIKIKSILHSFVNMINEVIIYILKQNYDKLETNTETDFLVISDFEGILQISNLISNKLNLILDNPLNISQEIQNWLILKKIYDLQISTESRFSVISDFEGMLQTSNLISNKLNLMSNNPFNISQEIQNFLILNELYNIEIGHSYILDDKEIRKRELLIYNIIHNPSVFINIQDFDSSGRNVLDLSDMEVIIQDSDSSGRNVLELFDIDFMFTTKSPIQISHSFNLVSG